MGKVSGHVPPPDLPATWPGAHATAIWTELVEEVRDASVLERPCAGREQKLASECRGGRGPARRVLLTVGIVRPTEVALGGRDVEDGIEDVRWRIIGGAGRRVGVRAAQEFCKGEGHRAAQGPEIELHG